MLGLTSNSKAAPAPCYKRSQSSPFVPRAIDTLKLDNSPYRDGNPIGPVTESLESITIPPTAAISSRPSGHQRSLTSVSGGQHHNRQVTRIQDEENLQAKGLTLPPSLFVNTSTVTFETSPISSPIIPTTKEKWSFLPTFKSTKNTEEKSEGTTSKFANWFQGESAPVTISVLPSPTKEKADPMEYVRGTPQDTPSETPRETLTHSPHRHPQPTSRLATSSPRLLSFFTHKTLSPPSPPPSQPPSEPVNDPLLALDVKKALYPSGPIDSFSPSSLKNLQQTAEGLLLDLQTAYKARVLALQECTTENDAQADELDEAQTRAKHLKSQLNEMSSRIAEQDKHMMNLVEDLAHEKQLRREEAEARERERSVRLVYDSNRRDNSPPRGRTQRVSLGSTTSSTPSMVSDCGSTDSEDGIATNARANVYQYPDTPRTLSPVATPFQSKHTNTFPQPIVPTKLECTNCHGVKPSAAVRLVGDLKTENTVLRRRVTHLEKELDGCLELVQGMVM